MKSLPSLINLMLFALLSLSFTSANAANHSQQTGTASYYANMFEGRKTANGEIYKHSLKTAAHRKLPFGTKVRVTNIANGKSVIVKINDRGPYSKGRIIDLSKSAFATIGKTSAGLLKVKVEVIK